MIHVGGGNTANMLDVWHRHGVEQLLFQALDRGAVLTGGSAGGLCWFEGGTTDSYGPTLQLLHEGLGMIKGSYCPHYDAEDQRQPLFRAALLDGSLPMGYASWNRVAIRFTPEGEIVEAVTSEPGGRARSRSTPSTAGSSRRTSRAACSRSASPAARCPPEAFRPSAQFATVTAISCPRLAPPVRLSRSPLQNRPGSNQLAGARASSSPIRGR